MENNMDNNNTALTDDEALEILAYLLTSAHGCITEPANYGILRLITAADYIARIWAPRVTGDLAEYLDKLGTQLPSEAARMDVDLDGFEPYISKQIAQLAIVVKRHGKTGEASHGS